MTRAWGYTRVSTGDQALSVLSQDKAIQAYCDVKGLVLANVFSDEAVSGKLAFADRPRGGALCKALQPGDHVVVHKLDRAWRNAQDCLNTARHWEKLGVTLHIVQMGMDLSSPMGKCFFTMAAAFAEMERDFISQRTKEGLAQTTKRLGRPPFGEFPGEDVTLKFILACHKRGLSNPRIAIMCNQTPHLRPRLAGAWSADSIRRVLRTTLKGGRRRDTSRQTPRGARRG